MPTLGGRVWVTRLNSPLSLTISEPGNRRQYEYGHLKDLVTGEAPANFKDQLVIPPFGFYWLASC
jgi:amylosucrase